MMESKNIKLRALEPEDIDLLYKWENNTSIWHFGSTLVPFSRFDLEQYVLNADKDIFKSRQVRFMISLKKGDITETIGTADLFDFDPYNKRAGIGILICDEKRGRGYASETLDILVDYAFRTLSLHQLYCNITADNTISIRLFEKKNFKLAGIKKEWNLHNGRWNDEFLYQLINT